MQLKYPGATVYLDDNDPRVAQIKQGKEHFLQDGQVVVTQKVVSKDRASFRTKVAEGTATLQEACEMIVYILDQLKK